MPIACLIYLGFRVHQEWDQIGAAASRWEFSVIGVVSLIGGTLLSVVNLGFEVQKWRVASQGGTSFGAVFQSVLRGKSYSVFLPKVAGDFVARVYDFRRLSKVEVVCALLLVGASQLLVTVVFGLIASMSGPYENVLITDRVLVLAIVLLLAAVSFLILIAWNSAFKRHFISGRKKWGLLRRFMAKLGVIQVLNVVGLSILRYLTMVSQYILIIVLIGVIPSYEFVAALAVFFLLKTVVPSVNIVFEFSFRSIGALTIFGTMTSMPTLDILFAIHMVWLINGVLPAIAGVLVSVIGGRTE